jgi:hypothetical protein
MTNFWTGTLIRERLFLGSKSEGLYWVLLCDDGLWYRIADLHHFFISDELESMQNKRVRLNARLDLLRGHRRLVVLSQELEEDPKPLPPSDAASAEEGA